MCIIVFCACLVLADTIRFAYAYGNGKIDPKWNLDNQQPEKGHLSLGQSSSGPVARPIAKSNRISGQIARGGSHGRQAGGRGQSSTMATVPRRATPPRHVLMVEIREVPDRVRPPGVRRGSNDFRS